MTDTEYFYWQTVLTHLAYMGATLVCGAFGWYVARDAERHGAKRKRILAQRRFMQRRITNLKKRNRALRKTADRVNEVEGRVQILVEVLNRYDPNWAMNECMRLRFEAMLSDPSSQYVITNLGMPSGLL